NGVSMQYSSPIPDLIRGRRSVRTYEKRPVPPESLRALESFIRSLPEPPFGSAVRFLAVSAGAGDEDILKGLGTYGVIRNPAGFVIGAVNLTASAFPAACLQPEEIKSVGPAKRGRGASERISDVSSLQIEDSPASPDQATRSFPVEGPPLVFNNSGIRSLDPAQRAAGSFNPSDDGLFDFGFLMEAVCLKLSDLGLGSCWLGGSFRKSRFSRRIGAAGGEVVPSVLSFGVPSGRKRWIERVVTAGAGSAARLPFEDLFFDGDSNRPLTAAEAGKAAQALESVRLAPSASNRQPWRVARGGGSFHFFLRMNAAYQRQMKWARLVNLQVVDMGIAACHFGLAAEASGLRGQWRRDPGSAPSVPDAGRYVVSWTPAE
ncbi:MAG: nitroreductase family protein, partial [bacterium]|nr:nitroreductase family protein [bacterium]